MHCFMFSDLVLQSLSKLFSFFQPSRRKLTVMGEFKFIHSFIHSLIQSTNRRNRLKWSYSLSTQSARSCAWRLCLFYCNYTMDSQLWASRYNKHNIFKYQVNKSHHNHHYQSLQFIHTETEVQTNSFLFHYHTGLS